MNVYVETPHGDTLEGYVRDNADLDGTFTLTCCETGERFTVNGWTCHVEILDDPPPTPPAQSAPRYRLIETGRGDLALVDTHRAPGPGAILETGLTPDVPAFNPAIGALLARVA